ncbi:GTPase IMAP family member 7-like isoform X6 [Sander lucioperca]|uniref:GTPase IMAP family member 7-like isoform X6 n=1 Tax=Sander lucioperca TaxID=283035 RepID=UPI0016536B88|nr:GTPase IMAP family member 7-like isoform X6 [Sander lucioperca]
MYEVTCPPYTADDLKNIFAANQDPDMSLLVVKEGFSPDMVWQEVENLKRITRKPTEEFIVVLPFGYKESDRYPFKCYTMEYLFSKLTHLAEDRHLMPTNTSPADQHASSTPTSPSPMMEGFTDSRKRLKRNPSGTEVNLVLLGMTGTGKSASGNTILGEKRFTSKASSKPVTTECQQAETVINGRRVRIIDTSDIFYDERKSSSGEHVRKVKELCQSGPCVYLLVIHVSRFTDGERDILEKLGKVFGSKVREQTVILFTRGKDLEQGGMSFEDFLHRCQPDLKKIVEKCGGRCVLFENSDSGPDQVEKLMEIVDRMLK